MFGLKFVVIFKMGLLKLWTLYTMVTVESFISVAMDEYVVPWENAPLYNIK